MITTRMRLVYCYCCLGTLLAIFFFCNQVTADLDSCRGALDIIFVLDRSGSVGNEFSTSAVEFVKNIFHRFVSPLLGVSFITFSNYATVHLDLTSDRTAVEKALTDLSKLKGNGGTAMYTGLEKAVAQIKQKRDPTTSIILVLTDGEDSQISASATQADKARELGAIVYAVGVAKFSRQQLEKVADKPASEHVFEAQQFDELARLIDIIINKTCIEILAAEPTEWCAGENRSVIVYGRGFTNGRAITDILCNFQVNATLSYITRPQYPIQDNCLVCNSPIITNEERGIILQVSVNNGLSFVSSNVTIDVLFCETTHHSKFGIIWILAIIGAILLFLLLLFLLWWFWPLCVNKYCCIFDKRLLVNTRYLWIQVGGVEILEPEEEEDEQEPHRVVTASYYGGRGPGGISGMRVDWGYKGSTKEGSKLIPAKDAIITEPLLDSPAKESGCCVGVKGAFAGCWAAVVAKYLYLASFRPVRKRSHVSSRSKLKSSESGKASKAPKN
ncbi:anthrax toxin receptor 1-like isoform X2 [Corticium candelabrum]|uniref:anthrax toxin receptor 1-like isoform X2 n=1 Tax=Corticium candelabrum TaxID=121492 RepID=UPI002E25383C|nr:anthrax toxin receptor 1-like isoform X2 [Corticium candelabrum]